MPFRLLPLVLMRAVLLLAAIATLEAHPNHFATPSPLRVAALTPAATTRAPAEAWLTVTVTDAKLGRPAPARIRITDTDGRALGIGPGTSPHLPHDARLALPGAVPGLPAEAVGVLYGQRDVAQGYAFQPDGSFYVEGTFQLPLPAGTFYLSVSKGYEFVHQTHELIVKPGDRVQRTIALERWIDMPQLGWHSADGHIHLRRSPRDNDAIATWTAAEDVHVGVLLQMGDFHTTYFAQYGFGARGHHQAGDFLLMPGQEDPRTPELGHTISFGAEQYVRFADEYHAYDRVFDRIHALGGISGYAHQAMSFNGARGMTLDVLTGKIDFLELLQFCVPEGPMATAHYYRLLDLGYRLTAIAGSDFPWCGRGRRPGEPQVGPQIGNARFYTHVDGPFSHDRWFAAVKAGRTFVTSGPMLELRVNDALPGATLDVTPGTTLRIRARAHGHPNQIPLQKLQLIAHGNVIAEAQPGTTSQSTSELTIEHTLSPEHGLWIAARAEAGPTQLAHTTPVYVTVNGDGFHNRATLAKQIDLSRAYLQEIRQLVRSGVVAPHNRPLPGRVKAHLEARLAEAERRLDELAQLR